MPTLDSLRDHWTPPAELTRSKPRPVQLSGSGIFMIVLALVLAAGGIVGSVIMRKLALDAQAEALRMQAEGQTVEGVVTRLWRTGGKSSRNEAAYLFFVDGVTLTNTADLNASHWRELSVGSPIAIRYLPAEPRRNYPEADPPQPTPFWLIILIGVIFIGLGALMVWVVRRELRLLRDGQAAPGVVTGNRAYKSNTVFYEFAVQGGETQRGRCSRRSIPAGSAICVLYDPENPKSNVPYPCQYVKIAEM